MQYWCLCRLAIALIVGVEMWTVCDTYWYRCQIPRPLYLDSSPLSHLCAQMSQCVSLRSRERRRCLMVERTGAGLLADLPYHTPVARVPNFGKLSASAAMPPPTLIATVATPTATTSSVTCRVPGTQPKFAVENGRSLSTGIPASPLIGCHAQ